MGATLAENLATHRLPHSQADPADDSTDWDTCLIRCAHSIQAAVPASATTPADARAPTAVAIALLASCAADAAPGLGWVLPCVSAPAVGELAAELGWVEEVGVAAAVLRVPPALAAAAASRLTAADAVVFVTGLLDAGGEVGAAAAVAAATAAGDATALTTLGDTVCDHMLARVTRADADHDDLAAAADALDGVLLGGGPPPRRARALAAALVDPPPTPSPTFGALCRLRARLALTGVQPGPDDGECAPPSLPPPPALPWRDALASPPPLRVPAPQQTGSATRLHPADIAVAAAVVASLCGAPVRPWEDAPSSTIDAAPPPARLAAAAALLLSVHQPRSIHTALRDTALSATLAVDDPPSLAALLTAAPPADRGTPLDQEASLAVFTAAFNRAAGGGGATLAPALAAATLFAPARAAAAAARAGALAGDAAGVVTAALGAVPLGAGRLVGALAAAAPRDGGARGAAASSAFASFVARLAAGTHPVVPPHLIITQCVLPGLAGGASAAAVAAAAALPLRACPSAAAAVVAPLATAAANDALADDVRAQAAIVAASAWDAAATSGAARAAAAEAVSRLTWRARAHVPSSLAADAGPPTPTPRAAVEAALWLAAGSDAGAGAVAELDSMATPAAAALLVAIAAAPFAILRASITASLANLLQCAYPAAADRAAASVAPLLAACTTGPRVPAAAWPAAALDAVCEAVASVPSHSSARRAALRAAVAVGVDGPPSVARHALRCAAALASSAPADAVPALLQLIPRALGQRGGDRARAAADVAAVVAGVDGDGVLRAAVERWARE